MLVDCGNIQVKVRAALTCKRRKKSSCRVCFAAEMLTFLSFFL